MRYFRKRAMTPPPPPPFPRSSSHPCDWLKKCRSFYPPLLPHPPPSRVLSCGSWSIHPNVPLFSEEEEGGWWAKYYICLGDPNISAGCGIFPQICSLTGCSIFPQICSLADFIFPQMCSPSGYCIFPQMFLLKGCGIFPQTCSLLCCGIFPNYGICLNFE